MKAGIANSLSARYAGACPFARTEVRMSKQWVVWWAKERASFQKSGEEEENRRGVSKESPQVFIQPLPALKNRNIFLTKPSIVRN